LRFFTKCPNKIDFSKNCQIEGSSVVFTNFSEDKNPEKNNTGKCYGREKIA